MSASGIIGITEREFTAFQGLLYDLAGIKLPQTKMALVSGRLGRRLRHYGLDSFDAYFRLVIGKDQRQELQVMLDLLTTNETHFFREPRHFDFVREQLLLGHRGELNAWCAACSTGEEPYSLAMTLEDGLRGGRWRILATDISTRVLEVARVGVYSMEAKERIPPHYVPRYCLKGVRSQEGTFAVTRALKERITFTQLNLNGDWPRFDRFHLVFLRNVMIYFDSKVKVRLVDRIADQLVPGGYLLIGHSENLNGISDRFDVVMPAVYRLR